jgi:Tol biopolymer transport system component
LENETLIDLSEQTMVSTTQPFVDLAAAWSPDGEWVVAVRREITEASATLGSQLWLMHADGTQAHALTTEPNFVHGIPVWSPDGEYLVFHRYSLQEQGAPPAI